MRKRGFLLLMALILTVTPAVEAAAVTKNEAQKQKNEAQEKLDAVNDSIENIEENREAVQDEIATIDDQLVDLLLTVDLITDDISAKQDEIDAAQAEYEEAKRLEEEQYESMKRRIKFMYERGDRKYIEMFLQSDSIADIINKADYVELLYEYDRQMLLSYQQTKEEEAQIKARLEEEKDELTEMQEEYVSESRRLQELIDEKKHSLEDFDAQLTAAKEKAGEYQEQIKKQTAVLKQIEAEEAARKKAEEEARKKAEAEAKRKAEEESKKKKEKENNEDNGNEDDNDEPAASQNNGNSGGSSEESSGGGSASPGDSAKGREIAEFACRYIGNPYVAGGTSLTEGCDCSGFTSAVYSNFGYSLPRNSYSQSTFGREVSYSEAQPGDIIYYGGHVGIYIGNGQIVHASTPATGIKKSNALYRSIITVRRIV
ncbi:MAG: C40 family peptidase [Lachnospiraceae bacterium]|nr:C40 family peptidase [Lachnospiraceae bacterium]